LRHSIKDARKLFPATKKVKYFFNTYDELDEIVESTKRWAAR